MTLQNTIAWTFGICATFHVGMAVLRGCHADFRYRNKFGNYTNLPESWGETLSALSLIIGAPLIEELVMCLLVRPNVGNVWAAGIFFGIVHGMLEEDRDRSVFTTIATSTAGILIGYAWETSGYLGAILVHAIWNLTVVASGYVAEIITIFRALPSEEGFIEVDAQLTLDSYLELKRAREAFVIVEEAFVANLDPNHWGVAIYKELGQGDKRDELIGFISVSVDDLYAKVIRKDSPLQTDAGRIWVAKLRERLSDLIAGEI